LILITETGEKITDISLSQAQEKARNANLSLIKVAPEVFKICDYGLMKYKKKQKEKRIKAQQRLQKIKEVRIGLNIDSGDLKIKINQIQSFLGDGLKTKVVMRIKKRQMSLKSIGVEKIRSVVSLLEEKGIGCLENAIISDGLVVFAILNPVKK